MSNEIKHVEFFCAGIPRPAGSKRAFGIKSGGKYTGRYIVTDSSGQKGKDWRGDLRTAALAAYTGEPFTGPVVIDVEFIMPRPKSHYGTGKKAKDLKATAPHRHTSKPDASKLTRALEDALTGILWRDDAQIFAQHIYKMYGNNPGVTVSVREVEQLDIKRIKRQIRAKARNE